MENPIISALSSSNFQLYYILLTHFGPAQKWLIKRWIVESIFFFVVVRKCCKTWLAGHTTVYICTYIYVQDTEDRLINSCSLPATLFHFNFSMTMLHKFAQLRTKNGNPTKCNGSRSTISGKLIRLQSDGQLGVTAQVGVELSVRAAARWPAFAFITECNSIIGWRIHHLQLYIPSPCSLSSPNNLVSGRRKKKIRTTSNICWWNLAKI